MELEKINEINEKIVDIVTILNTYSMLLKGMSLGEIVYTDGFAFTLSVNIKYVTKELVKIQDSLEENKKA